MASVVLRSHACRQPRFRHETLAGTASPVRSANSHGFQNRRRKRSPVAGQVNQQDRDRIQRRDGSVASKGSAANLVMGQVKILKRGEKLNPEDDRKRMGVSVENRKIRAKSEEDLDLVLGSRDRFGPQQMMAQKQITISEFKDGIYAGSAIFKSPPPSSVPVPAFLGTNGAATNYLRRLLQLDSV